MLISRNQLLLVGDRKASSTAQRQAKYQDQRKLNSKRLDVHFDCPFDVHPTYPCFKEIIIWFESLQTFLMFLGIVTTDFININ